MEAYKVALNRFIIEYEKHLTKSLSGEKGDSDRIIRLAKKFREEVKKILTDAQHEIWKKKMMESFQKTNKRRKSDFIK